MTDLHVLGIMAAIIGTNDRKTWTQSVREAENILKLHVLRVVQETGRTPDTYVREGDTRVELFALVKEHPEVSILILSSAPGNKPGPLVAAVTGKYAGLTSNLAFLRPTITYDANNVYLEASVNTPTVDYTCGATTANLPPDAWAPYVGANAFAHKGGVHVNAVLKDSKTYEHVSPKLVGNRQRVLLSDLSGKGSILYKIGRVHV